MNRMHRAVAAATAATVFGLVALPADADVVNGGFETGTFAGWTETGDLSFSGVDSFAARTGSFGAYFGPEPFGGISQSFATLAGTSYRISFALSLTDSAQPNSFSWTWNGITQSPSLSNAAAFGYTNFSALLTATGALSSIGFNFRDPQAFWLLDNVSVTAVPEPPVAALLGVAFLLGLLRLRKQAKSHPVIGASPA